MRIASQFYLTQSATDCNFIDSNKIECFRLLYLTNFSSILFNNHFFFFHYFSSSESQELYIHTCDGKFIEHIHGERGTQDLMLIRKIENVTFAILSISIASGSTEMCSSLTMKQIFLSSTALTRLISTDESMKYMHLYFDSDIVAELLYQTPYIFYMHFYLFFYLSIKEPKSTIRNMKQMGFYSSIYLQIVGPAWSIPVIGTYT